MRIQEAQKQTDLDADPDPEHCYKVTKIMHNKLLKLTLGN